MPTQNYFVPFAYMDSFAAVIEQEGLHLPHLSRLLPLLDTPTWIEGTEIAPSLPHEHALLNTLMQPQPTGLPLHASAPLASLYAHEVGACAAAHNTAIAPTGWAFITPCHWQVTPDRIILHDPAQLQLSEAHSKALFEAIQAWFAQDHITLVWDRADRWLAHCDSFVNLTTSSIERAIQRDVRQWLPSIEAAAQLQRLQTEVQMLLYNHPLHDERLRQGLQPVNALWVSGTGGLLPASVSHSVQASITVEQSLQTPALHSHWPQWKAAWEALDTTLFEPLLLQAQQTSDAAANPFSLTLSGERCAVTLHSTGPKGFWPRWQKKISAGWKKPDALALLKKL